MFHDYIFQHHVPLHIAQLTPENILQSKRPLRNCTKSMPWNDEVAVLDVSAHFGVDGTFVSCLLCLGSLWKTIGIVCLVFVVTLVFGEVFNGAFDNRGKNVPSSKFLLKTNGGSLEFLNLVPSAMESIPHDLGVVVDAQIYESFLHPADWHGDKIEDRKGGVLEVETEHCQKGEA